MGLDLSSNNSMSDINITPLVDVMLVLLIIFMVAAPVMERERSKREIEENRDKQQRLIALNLPALDNTDAAPAEMQTLILKIQKDLIVTLDKQNIADCSKHVKTADKREWEPCFASIESAVLETPDAVENGITVDADPMVPFSFVVGTMNKLYRAKVTKVSMFPRLSE